MWLPCSACTTSVRVERSSAVVVSNGGSHISRDSVWCLVFSIYVVVVAIRGQHVLSQ